MWSEAGMDKLRSAVRARLRAVLESGCPPLEPWVRAVLEQRLDSAALDLMELIRSGEDHPVPLENLKLEMDHVKHEPDLSDLNITCVKVEPEEQEIQSRPEPTSIRTSQFQTQNFYETETFQFCPQCGSTLGAQENRRPSSLPPLVSQPQCSFCGQSYSRDILLLEHNYTQDLQSARGVLEHGTAGFHCSVCGQDFSQVEALLDHMSEHLALSSAASHRSDSSDSETWSFENDGFDEMPLETICSVCKIEFSNSDQLQEHLRTHLR